MKPVFHALAGTTAMLSAISGISRWNRADHSNGDEFP